MWKKIKRKVLTSQRSNVVASGLNKDPILLRNFQKVVQMEEEAEDEKNYVEVTKFALRSRNIGDSRCKTLGRPTGKHVSIVSHLEDELLAEEAHRRKPKVIKCTSNVKGILRNKEDQEFGGIDSGRIPCGGPAMKFSTFGKCDTRDEISEMDLNRIKVWAHGCQSRSNYDGDRSAGSSANGGGGDYRQLCSASSRNSGVGIKISPPRMKRRKKKTTDIVVAEVHRPDTTSTSSNLDLIGAGRRSPPPPASIANNNNPTNDVTSKSNNHASNKNTSDDVSSNDVRCDVKIDADTAKDDSKEVFKYCRQNNFLEVSSNSLRSRSEEQSSPDITSDDTDGGRESGYVTLEDLQAQLARASWSSNDDPSFYTTSPIGKTCDNFDQLAIQSWIGSGKSDCGDAKKDSEVTVVTSAAAAADGSGGGGRDEIDSASLLKFTFTVKLESSLLKRRQLKNCDLADLSDLGLARLENSATFVSGRIDLTAQVPELSVTGFSVENCGNSANPSADCLDGRSDSLFESSCDIEGASSCNLEQEDYETRTVENQLLAAGVMNRSIGEHYETHKRNSKAICAGSMHHVYKGLEPGDHGMACNKENIVADEAGPALMARNLGKNTERNLPETSRFRKASDVGVNDWLNNGCAINDDLNRNRVNDDVTDLGTYLRPMPSKRNVFKPQMPSPSSDVADEATHMSWDEVIKEAQNLGIPLQIPARNRISFRQRYFSRRVSSDSSSSTSVEEDFRGRRDRGQDKRGDSMFRSFNKKSDKATVKQGEGNDGGTDLMTRPRKFLREVWNMLTVRPGDKKPKEKPETPTIVRAHHTQKSKARTSSLPRPARSRLMPQSTTGFETSCDSASGVSNHDSHRIQTVGRKRTQSTDRSLEDSSAVSGASASDSRSAERSFEFARSLRGRRNAGQRDDASPSDVESRPITGPEERRSSCGEP